MLMLVVGLIVGVLLSRAVLGNLAPDLYQQMFYGVSAQDVEDADAAHQQLRGEVLKLLETDVPTQAIEEHLAQVRQNEMNPMLAVPRAAEQRSVQMASLISAVLLAVVVVMFLETLVGPSDEKQRQVISPTVAKLKTVRFALMAVGLALLVAHPTLLGQLPWLFFVLLVVVALVLGFVPLGGRSAKSAQTLPTDQA